MGQGHPPTPKHDEPAEEGEEDESKMQQDKQVRLQAVGHKKGNSAYRTGKGGGVYFASPKPSTG